MLDRNNFIGLGEELDDAKVTQLLQEGREFIRPEGFGELMNDQKQVLSTPTIYPTKNPTEKTRSTPAKRKTLSTAGANIAFVRRLRPPQALESSDEQQLTDTLQPSEQIKQHLKSNSQPSIKAWKEKLNFIGKDKKAPPQQQNNNLEKVTSSPNLKDKLTVSHQDRVIIPEQHIRQDHKRTKSAPNISV